LVFHGRVGILYLIIRFYPETLKRVTGFFGIWQHYEAGYYPATVFSAMAPGLRYFYKHLINKKSGWRWL